jgi:hypothetical protein
MAVYLYSEVRTRTMQMYVPWPRGTKNLCARED